MPPDPFDRDPAATWGVAETVAPGVRRVTARNPSAMTFTGTATYLVGARDLAVIDPGPDDPAHRAAILDAIPAGGRVRAILVTHTHRDHSEGAPALARETGAPTFAFGPHGAGMSEAMAALVAAAEAEAQEGVAGSDSEGASGLASGGAAGVAVRGASGRAALGGGEGADAAFRPDATLAEGESVAGEGWRLTALRTPGHLSNHLSFALEGAGGDAGVLFTGDTVMGWATTLVSPPEGDMAAFMETLGRLRAGDWRRFLPGHGRPVEDPAAMLDWQIAHRRGREAQIRAALAEGPADAAALARRIYAGLDPALLPAAARNVFAHLLALTAQGRAAAEGPPGAAARFRLT